ncbi:MAG: YCF48-related protein [Bacteroidota bacterium]
MKNLYLVIVCTMISAGVLFADGFHGVHSPNGTEVWAVGNGGNVFHSIDAGTNWSSSFLGSSTLRTVWTRGTAVWMAGENGAYHRTTDAGASWTSGTLNGGATLRSMIFINDSGWVVGDNGMILFTTDAGATWNPQISNTTQSLRSVSFSSSSVGYAVGTAGTMLKTANGGAVWTADLGNTSKDLNAVAVVGRTVYVVGVDGLCLKSGDAGTSWETFWLKTDVMSDVTDVFILDDRNVNFTGGGGYIRKTVDGGETYTFGIHGMHATLSDIFFFNDSKAWACNPKNNAILRTTDGGNTWLLPQGTTVNYVWSLKQNSGGTVRGNAFSTSSHNKDVIYVALATNVYASYNRGDTWTQIATMPSGGSKVNSFYVSPKDTNMWVAAYGSPDRIVRTTNRGVTWTDVISRSFTEYGMPLEMDGSHPDTLLFGPEDGYVYRSTNFGATWDTLSFPDFRSPCDIVIVRDSAGIVWVGDGITGSGQGEMFRSTDGGVTWALIYTVSGSEIPTIANGDQSNGVGYATAWGSGGVQKTTNFGTTWTSVSTIGSTWGVDIARDDPNVPMFGVYGGGTSYLSTNAGGTFSTSSLSGSNYAILCYDRATFLAQQSGGVYKYTITYTVPTNAAAVALVAPNGGEVWNYGTLHNITWNASNLANVKLEYKTGPGAPWQSIVASTPGSSGSYTWTIPNASSTQARVRVSNAAGGNPIDSSNGFFTLGVASISSQPGAIDFDSVGFGESAWDTLRIFNAGTAPLVVSNITSTGASFTVSRSSFTIPIGGSDTITVVFTPQAIQAYADTLQFTSNTPTRLRIPLSGEGVTLTSVEEDGLPTAFALMQNYPNPFNPSTRIRYALPSETRVTLTVFNTLGQEVAILVNDIQQPGWHTVEFSPRAGVDLSSGVYLYKLEAGSFVETRKMLLVK